MKFMKLGSKADSFQSDGDNIRYVATELATDVVVNVGDVKFFLHKFPLLSKSARLQKLVGASNEENGDEINIADIPGGPAAFEICAKFCYGMTVTLNAYNVAAARCAAEYLEMYETVEKGNLIYKIEVFLNSSILRTWKDSIIVLQTTRSLLPWTEELKIVSHCLDSIASKALVDTSHVEWSYTYNRHKLLSENGANPTMNGVRRSQTVPKDWWVEDLCELHIDLYKRIIMTIKSKGEVSAELIGEALHAYAQRRIPGFSKGTVHTSDFTKYRSLLETIVWLLPTEKQGVSCSFLINLLKAGILLDCGEKERKGLMKRISQQIEEASVADLLIRAPSGSDTVYDSDTVQTLVEEYVVQDRNFQLSNEGNEFQESRNANLSSDKSRAAVAKLIDGYLAEIARDPNLPLLKFLNLAETVSSFPRTSHDGVYRAIDMFLKEHPGITKSERKRVCRLMDCKKLSPEACMHAVQNERLPLRVVVQVLFFEQVRAAAASGGNSTPDLPDLPGSVRALLPGGSSGSSRSTTTNTEDDWDSAEDVKAAKSENTRLALSGENVKTDNNTEKAAAHKMRGATMSKLFSKLWSGKEKGSGSASGSETSSSPGFVNAEETKSIP